jgi:[ribosomal protein S5]-alanine N-acetyltransferase
MREDANQAETTVPLVRIETPRLALALPPSSAAARLLAYRIENATHLAPWEPPAEPGWDTEAYQRAQIEKNRRELVEDRSMRLALTRRDDPEGPILGQVNLSNFVRGAFHACHVGYSLDHRFEGQGLMHEALGAVIRHAFDVLRLHRVQANYLPTNERSARLLAKLGFVVEGYARDYLYIAGGWRDHVLTALTSPSADPPAARAARVPPPG